jgi:hypothetical protein
MSSMKSMLPSNLPASSAATNTVSAGLAARPPTWASMA